MKLSPSESLRIAVWTALAVAASGGVGLLMLTLGRCANHDAVWTSFPLDDAWIHLVYARSFAQSLAPWYNPGEPAGGMTSLLYPLSVAPLLAAGIGPVLAARVVGVVAHGLTAVFLGLAVERLARRGGYQPATVRYAVAAAVVLAIIDPLAVVLAMSGMEASMARLWLAGLLWALTAQRPLTAGVFSGLALLTRPELGLTVVPLVVVFGSSLKHIVRSALPPILALLAMYGFYLSVTGRPLPSSFYVKVSTPYFWSPPFTEALGILLRNAATLCGLMIPAAALSLAVTARNNPDRRVILAMTLWFFLFLLAIAAMGLTGKSAPADVTGSGLTLYNLRYWAIGLVILPPLTGLLFAQVLQRPAEPGSATAQQRGSLRSRISAGIGWAALTLFIVGIMADWTTRPDLLCRNCANIQGMQIEVGTYLREHTPPDASVAVSDAGAIRYFSDRRVIDLVGLNLSRAHLALTPDERLDVLRPDYAALFPHWHGGPQRMQQLGYVPLGEVRIEDNTICAGSRIVVWRRGDVPEAAPTIK